MSAGESRSVKSFMDTDLQATAFNWLTEQINLHRDA
jgi:hypothetical protein